MRIVTQQTLGGPEVLEIAEAPVPGPGPGEILVGARAIGVNPLDVAVREGWYPIIGEPPFTLGWDVAGIVEAVGDGVDDLAVGDRVFGMPRIPEGGRTYADKVVVRALDVLRTPDWLDDVRAAALPLVAITAYRSLVEVGGLREGQRVLVQAAGGGVGHLAVQLAKALGAEVHATASAGKIDFVRGLGADHVIDYRERRFEDEVGDVDVDVVIDPFGGENVARSLSVVRDGGVIASLLDVRDQDVTAAEQRSVVLNRIKIVPSRVALQAFVDLVAEGRADVHVAGTFALDDVADAHRELATGIAGKLVLVP